jgi:EmrB/QacA subfamily drug resistance transporter
MPYTKQYKYLVLALIVSFYFMVMLDMSIVTIAIPRIMSSLGENLTNTNWIMIAYTISSAIFIMPMIYVIKKYGLKIPLIICISIFIISSIFCGFSTSLNFLIFFRIIQGVGGAGIMPLGLALMAKIFAPDERAKAMGIWAIGAMVAPAIGLTLGGFITEYITWRWIFFINIPVGIISLIGITIILENDYVKGVYKGNFDIIGFILFSIAIGFLMVVFNEGEMKEWNSAYIHISELISASGFLLFFLIEPFIKNPLINFNIFKYFNFSVITLINGVRAMTLFGIMLFVPVYLQNIMNNTPFKAGLIIMPQAIAVAIFAPLAGRLSDKVGNKTLIFIGMFLSSLSFIMYANLSLQSNLFAIIFPEIIRGIGFGFLYAPIMTEGINAVPVEFIPDASSLLPVTMRIFAGFGVALFDNLLTIKQIFYAGKYANTITYSNNIFLQFTGEIKNNFIDKINPGILANLRINPSLAMIDALVHNLATISAYDYLFLAGGSISFVGCILALFLKKSKPIPIKVNNTLQS